MDVEEVFALDAATTRIYSAVTVPDLTFVEPVQEIESVAIGTVSLLTEIPAFIISVLADTSFVNSVPLDAFLAGSIAVN